jgi:hypothetical protein
MSGEPKEYRSEAPERFAGPFGPRRLDGEIALFGPQRS